MSEAVLTVNLVVVVYAIFMSVEYALVCFQMFPQDGILKRLREETHVLSKSKRRLEQHLVQIKSHLWNLDSMRKTIKSKAANLSRALELDAQRLKVRFSIAEE